MSLKQRIEDDFKQAFKAGDKPKVAVLRMVKSKLQEKQVSLRGEKGKDYELADDEVQAVVAAYAKQRRDSIESYVSAGGEELAEQERGELALVEEYLPQQLGDDELRGIVAEVVTETGAASMKDMGAVMKGVMARVRGAADGKRVQQFVRELLAG
jgi:uncharacterized protein YqeY